VARPDPGPRCIVATLVFLLGLLAHGGASVAREEPVPPTAAPDAGPAEEPDGGALDPPPEPPPALPIPLSITISGGSSLGAYQGGYLYYLTEVIKRNPELFELHMITGASAGSVNGLLAVMSAGKEPIDDPSESLFYEVWTGLRYDEMLDVKEATELAMSSAKALRQLGDQVKRHWDAGIDERVDIVMGVTVMRRDRHRVELAVDLSVPRQEEKFTFRIRGRGKGRLPAVENYQDPTSPLPQPLLPFAAEGERTNDAGRDNFDILRDVVFASSSVPVAFPPQQVGFCSTAPGDGRADEPVAPATCDGPQQTEGFYDGGLFDKWPLRQAHRTINNGLTRDGEGGLAWREVPLPGAGTPDNDVFYIYVDPEDANYPELPPRAEGGAEDEEEQSLFSMLAMFFGGYVVSSQARELCVLIEEHPEIRDRIGLGARDLPSASGFMGNFFGFLDREFRRYDFFVGMGDAQRFVERYLAERVARTAGESVELQLPNPERSDVADDAWRPYFCLRGAVDGDAQHAESCGGKELYDFRILLQASLDRLYDHCRRLPADTEGLGGHCARARDGETPPRIAGLPPNAAWQRREDESEFKYMMRLLEHYEFHFKDLGLERDEAHLGMSAIREEILHISDALAKRLPWGERQSVRIFGKPAINFFKYSPAWALVYFVAGKGVELGLSATGAWMKTRWIRLNLALQTQGLIPLLSEEPNVLTLTPLLGFEIEIPRLSSAMVQLRGGLRLGYQLSTGDGFHRGDCNHEWFSDDSLRCSAPVAQAVMSLSFYERIRIQGAVEWFPRWLPPMDEFRDDVWNGLFEIGWQWISPF
jgi:predicted acylesterase/phospholipase RssA